MSGPETRAWGDWSREFELACSLDGEILTADERAGRHAGLRAGRRLGDVIAAGCEPKLADFLAAAPAGGISARVELPLVHGDHLLTVSCIARRSDTTIEILGSVLPQEHLDAMRQVQESLAQVVELNRQVLRQKREIERQNEALGTALGDLRDSREGITSLHTELADQSEVLQRNADVKNRIIANVSHELRTPVHTILGLSRLLLEEADGHLSEEQHKQVHFIRTSAQELSTLIEDVLDLSTAESGRAVMRMDRFTVGELFAAMRGMMKPLVPDPGAVDLRFDDGSADAVLETDRGKLNQILRNLVTNALKFTETGHVEVTATVAGSQVTFRVTDTGIGIAAADLERIFEEFSQIETPLHRRVKGSGLGLPLARRLAQLLEGRLDVSSEPGSGSTFVLTIPTRHSEVREFETIANRALDERLAPILVVEDDRKTVFIYERYLAMAGFQVVPARTVEEAEAVLARLRPAAIVLDVMLDGEASWSFLAKLKSGEQTRDIPVLVVTITNKEQKARALGADEFWLKPVDRERLVRKLGGLARRGEPSRLLVIDDDEKSRYLIRRLIEGEPFRLLEAESGAEGLHLARRHSPDVILLDFLLRGTTAFDVLDELKADPRTRGIPVVIVTSHALQAEDLQRLAVDTDAILSKDTLSRELAINRIRDALRKSGIGAPFRPVA